MSATVIAPRAGVPQLPSGPDRETSRHLLGVNAARGVALLGMMAVHALLSSDASGNPTVVYSLAAGRSAALFAVLAGVGIAFLTRRRRVALGPDARRAGVALATRALVIGAIGLALGYGEYDIAAVILPYYAALFLFAIPIVLLPTWAVGAVGVLAATVAPVASQLVRSMLPAPRMENPSTPYLVGDPIGFASQLTLTGIYPAVPWIAYLCAGVVVGRLRLSSARVATRLLAVGALLAAAASLASWLLLDVAGGRAALGAAGTGVEGVDAADVLAFGGEGVTPATSLWWLTVDAAHTATPPDLLHTTGVAVALIGALLLLARTTAPQPRRILAVVLNVLGAAGGMPLTLYTAHVVFMNSPLDDFAPVTGFALQVVVALGFALAWRQSVGRGPIELLVSEASGAAARRVGRDRKAAGV